MQNFDKNTLSVVQSFLQTERANGCFFVTVATIELVISLLQYSFSHNEKMLSELSNAVVFFLTEIFSSYHQWQKLHVESWDNIGKFIFCENV